MGTGVETYDASGNLVFDGTTSLARFLGSVYTGTSNGSITVAALTTGRPFFFSVAHTTVSGDSSGFFTPPVTINRDTGVLSWAFTNANQSPATITYGVF